MSDHNQSHHFHHPQLQAKDLSKEAPRSPYTCIAGFAILARSIDKCRADILGTVGEYSFNCPLDRQLFSFKGIQADEFREFVSTGATDDEIGVWTHEHGVPKTTIEIETWSKSWSGKFDTIVREDHESFA